MGQDGFQEENLCWEPRPEKIPALIQSWIGKRGLPRPRLARILTELVTHAAQAAA
jgi:hypothetical protein